MKLTNRAPESVRKQLISIAEGYNHALANNSSMYYTEYVTSEIVKAGFGVKDKSVVLPVRYGENEKEMKKEYIKQIRELFQGQGLFILDSMDRKTIIHNGEEIVSIYHLAPVPLGIQLNIVGEVTVVDVLKSLVEGTYNTERVPSMDRVCPNKYQPALLSSELIKINIPEIDCRREFYPDFDTPANTLDRFYESSSRVLLMIGDPGTGKSTYVTEMLKHRGWKKRNLIIDDQELMEHQGIISMVREGDDVLVIFEDADGFVESRASGNKKMTALLNITSGIAAPNVRIIILTNLASLNKVDQALIRPGRCFDIMQFRKLTMEEANAAREAMDKPPIYTDSKKTYTLSEVFNDKDTHTPAKQRNVGFAL